LSAGKMEDEVKPQKVAQVEKGSFLPVRGVNTSKSRKNTLMC